jgi:hypothetical protein
MDEKPRRKGKGRHYSRHEGIAKQNLICRNKNESCMRPDMLLSKYINNVKILNWCAPLFGMCVSALDLWLLAELE